MMTEFFQSPFRILQLRGGPDGQLLDVFTEDLRQSGFAQITARRHIRAAEHLLYWANRECIRPSAFDDQALDEFARHLRRCRCKGFGHTHRRDLQNGARLFIGNLRRAGLLPIPAIQETVEDPHVLTGKQCTTAVRAFLRYLIADGKYAAGLDACIPALAHWRLSSLPRYLQPEEVERVIAACSATLEAGLRDRAILLLLARLGLRAGDILRLCLSDLDWKNGARALASSFLEHAARITPLRANSAA